MKGYDRHFDLNILDKSNRWSSVGQVRRAQRQLLRQWAVAGRRDYGKKSIDAYLAYYEKLSLNS